MTAPVSAQGAKQITASATIQNGASLSGAIDLKTRRLSRIDMPSGWTTANLTFQVSYDGTTYNNLYDASGNEYTVTAAASCAIIIPLADFLGVQFLKIRSGTSGVAVNQVAERTIKLVLVQ